MILKDLIGKTYNLILILLSGVFLSACSNLQEPVCEITNLEVSTMSCTTDSTYHLTINFEYKNAGNDFFEVYTRNDKPEGYFKLSELPVTLENFKRSGNDFDFIKICINDHPDCCEVLEFEPPDCSDKVCEISNLTVDVGECTTENNYMLTLDFDYNNPGNDFFELYGRENKPLGYYKLSDLPVSIENFERSGKDFDFIKVCINDHPDCCEVLEFEPPDCSDKACEISNLTVDVGDCISENHYMLTLDFDYINPGNEFFEVYGRKNNLLGYYKISDLPVTIENYVGSGNDFDFIMVCINDHPDCCAMNEFEAPVCTENSCKISNLELEAGVCVSDTTYNLTLNFEFENVNNNFFEVFGRENKYIGIYNLADLPVTIPNFKKSGKDYDFVKVCINDNSGCCLEAEIKSPDCQ